MLKRLKGIVLFVLVFVCLVMVACSNIITNTPTSPDNKDPGQNSTTHQHTWGEWITTQDATCENKGYKTRTCSGCSETEREDINAKGHTFGEWETITESTCTSEGHKRRICPECNTEETDVVAAKGHTFGESVQTVAPNCTDDGESKKVCTVCEYEETEIIPANGHTYVDYICSVCNAVAAEKAVQTVKIANTSLLLPLNTPVKLDVQIYPTDAIYTSVTYTIDERNNSCSATITDDGVLSCTQLGSVRIRVTVDNVSSSYVTFNVPTEIRTAEEFDAIRNNLRGYYILCNDIDLSAYSTWIPIGYATKAADGSLSYSGTGFQGEFNGNGYTVSGVNIDLAQTNLITVGLFGFVDTSAVVSNVKVEANVVGTASASEYIGTLTGVNYGVIDNCEIDGDVDITGALYVGGIVGQNNGNLTDCTANVSIKASNSNSNGYYVGGIAGQFVIGNMDNNTAKAYIKIASCNFCYVGGITGNAYGSFSGTKCGVTIDVSANSSATSYIGGVVGKIQDSDSEIAFDLNNTTITGVITVENAYKLYVGGIAGYGDVFNNCINDIDITVTSSNNTYVGGIAGKSTKISNSKNIGAISVNSTSTVYLGGIVGSTEVLNNATNYTDISVSAATTYFGGVAGEVASAENVYNYCYELLLRASSSASFGGVIGRCTQKIENSYNTANLKVTRSDSSLYLGGIVGDSDVTSNIVKNATNSGKIIVDVSQLGTAYIGGIAGKATYVSNSANSATVIFIKVNSLSGRYDQIIVGGLCGHLSANVENSYSYASITLENTAMSATGGYNAVVGGLVGTANNVSGSYATGDVSVSLYNGSVNAGGLIGKLNGTASDSYARGSVAGVTTDEIKIGGLVAYAPSGSSVQNCYAAYNYLTANITSNGNTAYVGGLVAHNVGTVTDSYAMNYINTIGSGSGDTIYAGGVIGYNNGTVSNSYSSSATEHVLNTDISVDIDCTSNLSANVYVGGFVGYNNSTITNCYAGAEVIGRGCYTGGFVGYQSTNGSIGYALALAPVNSGISGQTHTGGFSGNDAGYYTSCIFSTTGTQIDASNGAGGTTVSGIVGRSETDLLNTSTLSGFDTSIWTIASGSIPTLTLNSNWKVYNDGYDNFNVLKNVVNPDRQYVKVSDYMVEIKFEYNWDLPLSEIVVLEKESKITMSPNLITEGYYFVGWFIDEALTKPFTVDGTYTVNEDITLYAYFRKVVTVPESETYTYNGEQFYLTTLDHTGTYYTVEGIYEATDAGIYTVTLTPTNNYCWSESSEAPVTVTWVIQKAVVAIPESETYTYNGELFSLTTLDMTGKYYTVDGVYEATDAGEHSITLTLNKNYCWSNESIDPLNVTWLINKKSIDIPQSQLYFYSGEEITLTTIDLNSKYYTVDGIYKATDGGEYTVTIALNKSCCWSDGTTEILNITWVISDTLWYNTDDTQFIISNIAQLAGLAQLVNNGNDFGNIIITLNNNIDLKNYEWSPIGISGFEFAGIFDGKGYAIRNFKITGKTTYAGLFGHNIGIIENLGIENFTIDVNDLNGEIRAGGLAGYNYGTVNNCYAIGDVSSTGVSDSYAGGLVGYNIGTVTNCYATGDVSSTSDSNSYAGGLAGYNDGTVNNCYATGDVSSTSDSYSYAGGLVGDFRAGTVNNCYATGDVSSTSDSDSYAGGLVGKFRAGTVNNCYATGDVFSSSIDYGTNGSTYAHANSYAGGLVGSIGYYCDTVNCYATGDVSSRSKSKYRGENHGYSSHSDSKSVAGGLAGHNSSTVTNCYATGDVSSNSSSIDISTPTPSHSYCYAGGLVGYNDSTVTNCYATGDVSFNSSAESNDYSAGGLIGFNTTHSTVANCYRYIGQNFTLTINEITTYSATNTKGTAKTMEGFQSVAFHSDTLGWDAEIWNFVEGEQPNLKNVSI